MDNQNQMIHLISIIYIYITSYIKIKFLRNTSSFIIPQKSFISFANLSNNSNDNAGYKLNLDVPTIYKPIYLSI